MYNFLTNLNHKNIFIIGVCLRLSIFIYLILFPFDHADVGKIGPLTFQTKINDLEFYLQFGEQCRYCFDQVAPWLRKYDYEYVFQFSDFFKNYMSVIKFDFYAIEERYPGFIFPLLLLVTNYEQNNAFILNSIFFSLEIISMYFWSKYIFSKIDNYAAIIFVILPVPLILGLLPSTDTIIFVLSTYIIINIDKSFKKNDEFIYFLILFIIVFSRPSGLIILIFSIFFRKKKSLWPIFFQLVIFILGIIYYTPYAVIELRVNYIAPSNYFYNYLIKFFYIFGFNPTSSNLFIVSLIKYIIGSFLMIGYFYSFVIEKFKYIIFINLFILFPVIIFGAAWRYILPASPFLFICSYLFFRKYFIVKLISIYYYFCK